MDFCTRPAEGARRRRSKFVRPQVAPNEFEAAINALMTSELQRKCLLVFSGIEWPEIRTATFALMCAPCLGGVVLLVDGVLSKAIINVIFGFFIFFCWVLSICWHHKLVKL